MCQIDTVVKQQSVYSLEDPYFTQMSVLWI